MRLCHCVIIYFVGMYLAYICIFLHESADDNISYCPGGNATDPIWRVLASSDGISSWTLLRPQHSNPNPNPLANQLWFIDFPTPPAPLLTSINSLASLNLLSHWKTNARFMQDAPKAVGSIPYVSVAYFSSLKQNFIAFRSSKVSSRPDYIFKYTSSDN